MKSYTKFQYGFDYYEISREVTNPKLYDHRKSGEFLGYLNEQETKRVIKSLIRDGYTELKE